MSGIRTDNDFFIGGNGSQVGPILPVVITTREQGLRTAAWLVAISMMLPHEDGHPDVEFDDVLEAVMNT